VTVVHRQQLLVDIQINSSLTAFAESVTFTLLNIVIVIKPPTMSVLKYLLYIL